MELSSWRTAKEPTTWRTLITVALGINSESWKDVLDISFDVDKVYGFDPLMEKLSVEDLVKMTVDQKLDLPFDHSHSTDTCPIRFTLWTENFVYFSYEYDGKDLVVSVLRNPPKTEPIVSTKMCDIYG